MGCITATGYRLGQSLEVTGYKATTSVVASGFSRYSPIQVSGVTVCPIYGMYIYFDKDSLSWLGADNRAGVTKYNTLTASGSWSLAEVEIEELL